MTNGISNPRMSNEVLSDKIEALGAQVSRIDAKFDVTITRFVTRETFDLKISDIDRVFASMAGKRQRDLNWVVPFILYVLGQLLLYLLLKGKI